MSNVSERRTSRRFTMTLPLSVKSEGAAETATQAETRDVSFRGLYSMIDSALLLTAVLLLLFPRDRKDEVRVTAAFAAFVTLALSVYVFVAYDKAGPPYQFAERIPWIPALGISYHIAADGIALTMVLLTGLVIFTGSLVSWGIQDRPREFYALLLILVSGVFGVFVSRDGFLLFFFYELAIFPMYILIATWGSTRLPHPGFDTP